MPAKPDTYRVFTEAGLNAAGINLQAILSCNDLSPAFQSALAESGMPPAGRSLILFGNGGPAFWRAFRQQPRQGSDPLDAYAKQVVGEFMERQFAGLAFRFLYPGNALVPLQALGQQVGWHQDSPLKIGISDTWGLWFAYRALVWVDADLAVSPVVTSVSPCGQCSAKPCVAACPAGALESGNLDLARCLAFRLQDGSPCALQCVARQACPVAPEQRYDQDQIAYHYGHSLPHLRRWRHTLSD